MKIKKPYDKLAWKMAASHAWKIEEIVFRPSRKFCASKRKKALRQ